MPNNVKKEDQSIMPISFWQVHTQCKKLACQIKAYKEEKQIYGMLRVIGVPNGGLVPAALLVRELNQLSPGIADLTGEYAECNYPYDDPLIIVDEIVDSGDTIKKFRKEYPEALVVAIYQRYNTHTKANFVGEVIDNDDWLKFEWEK